MNDHIGWRWLVHVCWPTHVYLPIRARQSLTHSPLHMHASPSWSWPPRNTHHNDNKLTTAWLGLSAAERSNILKWISYVRLDRVTWHAWLTMIVYVHKTISSSLPYGYLNLKWAARDLKSASNRVPIRVTYFGLSERHDPNISILSPENPFAKMINFWVLLLEKMTNGY